MTVNGGGRSATAAARASSTRLPACRPSGAQVNFCNTGHWASIGWFVSSELIGNKKARMYDGSMVEWTMLKGGSMEQKVKLQ